MIPKLLAVCCGPLLFAACALGVATRPASAPGSLDWVGAVATGPADARGTSEFVEAILDYTKPGDVPAPYQHLIDWHAGTGPVVLLITAGGRRACAIPPFEAPKVRVRQPYRCHWSGAR